MKEIRLELACQDERGYEFSSCTHIRYLLTRYRAFTHSVTGTFRNNAFFFYFVKYLGVYIIAYRFSMCTVYS